MLRSTLFFFFSRMVRDHGEESPPGHSPGDPPGCPFGHDSSSWQSSSLHEIKNWSRILAPSLPVSSFLPANWIKLPRDQETWTWSAGGPPHPSASQPSILLEQASPATDPPSVRKPEVGKASIRQGNHPYYQVAGKPPIRQPPQPTHQLPIIQMRKPVRSNLSKMKKPHLQRQKLLFSSLAFSSSPPPSSWPNTKEYKNIKYHTYLS